MNDGWDVTLNRIRSCSNSPDESQRRLHALEEIRGLLTVRKPKAKLDYRKKILEIIAVALTGSDTRES